jgi:hypothetical protein
VQSLIVDGRQVLNPYPIASFMAANFHVATRNRHCGDPFEQMQSHHPVRTLCAVSFTIQQTAGMKDFKFHGRVRNVHRMSQFTCGRLFAVDEPWLDLNGFFMLANACDADVDRASKALQAFVSDDEGKALDVLCEDLRMKDPGGLFACDIMRLRRFLVHMSSDARRRFHMAPWSYAGRMLRFHVAFRTGGPQRGKVEQGGTSMSIWVDLSKDGRIQEMDIRYRPETIISALSRGLPDRIFRIVMYKAGLLRSVSARVVRG